MKMACLISALVLELVPFVAAIGMYWYACRAARPDREKT